ncbi:MAG TPA: universal stress protein [Anaerolineae bacterium]|nr:universal stress protein [Anaerolineae bacterium]
MAAQKILIPLDESIQSREILKVVQRFFHPEESHLILLQVVYPELEALEIPPAHAAREWTSTIFDYLEKYQSLEHEHHVERQKLLKADILAGLTKEATSLINEGYQVTPVVRFGHALEQIEAYIKESRVDLVAMVTHAREGIGRLLFGSVAGALVHDLPVPVLLLHPTVRETNNHKFQLMVD